MEQELVGIQIQIAGKAYPLKIQAAETEMVQNVAENINDKINTLQKTYPRQDKQDYISMAFLSYAIDAQKNLSGIPTTVQVPTPQEVAAAAPTIASENTIVSEELTEKILHLNAFLDKILEA